MIDIHCHLIPDVDDGPHSLEEACAMVEMAAADGITQVVATPHCNARYAFSLERNRTLLAELAAATAGRLTLSCACEIHSSYENLERVLAEPSTYTISQRELLAGGVRGVCHRAPDCPEIAPAASAWVGADCDAPRAQSLVVGGRLPIAPPTDRDGMLDAGDCRLVVGTLWYKGTGGRPSAV